MEGRYKLRFFYSVFLGFFTAFVGILFIAEASDLYFSGVAALGSAQGMYSREAVGERLTAMLAPMILWILAVIGGVIVYALLPAAPKKKKGDAVSLYARLRGRAAEERAPDAYAELRRMERVRLAVRIVTAAFCLLAAAMCIVYLATAANFTSLTELDQNVLSMVANVLPWVGAAFLLLLGEAVFEAVFARRMLPRLKLLVGSGSVRVPTVWEQKSAHIAQKIDNKYTVAAIRLALFALAVVFIALGVWNGGAEGVLHKAIKICSECIGMG